ncbi:MAG TPA: glycerol-3-phosphate dehydrogenase [Terriglobia bacterium]|nr:glycerol-3-phosphate dehydrogenase [Terriglobia bacterium]
MADVVILGAGLMGSAFSFPLADLGHTVHLVGTHLDRAWIQGVRDSGVHPKLKLKLHERVVPYTHDQLADALRRRPELIVLGVNSLGVDWAIENLGTRLKDPPPILMLTKGLRGRDGTLHVLPAIVRDGLARYGLKDVSVGGVAGPCIAGELAVRRDSSTIITYADGAVLERVLKLVAAPYYHARPSTDIVGVEVCAGFKNLYTLAVGYPAGYLDRLGEPPDGPRVHNLAASLFAQAIREICHVVVFLGGKPATPLGLPGVGDLYVTCQGGRNMRIGYLFGRGERFSKARTDYPATETIEGAQFADAIGSTMEAWFREGRIQRSAMPLAAAMIDAVCHDVPLTIPWTEFHRD